MIGVEKHKDIPPNRAIKWSHIKKPTNRIPYSIMIPKSNISAIPIAKKSQKVASVTQILSNIVT